MVSQMFISSAWKDYTVISSDGDKDGKLPSGIEKAQRGYIPLTCIP